MPGFAVALLALAGAVAVVRLRPLGALAVLVLAAVLVPGPLVVPFLHSSYLTVQHVLVLAGVARLVLQESDHAAARLALRPTPVHVALAALLVVAGVVGIALSPQSGRLGFAGYRLLDLADQLAFFVVCLTLVRRVGDARRVLAVAAVAVVVSSLIAVGEHVTGGSYGHWLFSRLPGQAGTDAAYPLSIRGGESRVRAGGEFALQFAWMSVTLLPVLIAVGLRARRARLPLTVGGTVLVTLGVYWSFTRTALAALVVVIVVLALLSRDRVLAGLSAVLGAVAYAGYLAVPSVAEHLSASADVGSIDVRTQRLAPIMHAVAQHPLRGLGLGELVSSGFQTTDNALLLEYAELGVVGATLLVVLLVVTVAQTGRALLVPDPRDRLLAAACTTGALVFVASAMTYDAATLLQDVHLLWLLVAVATVLAQDHVRPVRLPRPSGRLVLATGAAALLVGGLAAALAPVHAARDYELATLTATHESVEYDPVSAADSLVGTACGLLASSHAGGAHVSVDCENTFGAAGEGRVRIQAPSRAALLRAETALARDVRGRGRLTTFTLRPVDEPATGRATALRTAPLWLPLLALGLLSLVPWRRSAGAAPTRAVPGPPPPARVAARPAAGRP